MVSGGFEPFTCTVHFISVIITSAPLQIVRHEIWEGGEPGVEFFYLPTQLPRERARPGLFMQSFKANA